MKSDAQTIFSAEKLYTEGKYLDKNPLWHTEESPWKAKQVLRMLEQNHLAPKTICEVGCGAGEVLKRLQEKLPTECELSGYDISPQAIALSKSRANGKLRFTLGDITTTTGLSFDLILILDVIEHLEDYFRFLRAIKPMGSYKIIEIPLDLSVQTVFRSTPLIRDRQKFGHIHYFSKEIALQLLRDLGYQIIDHFYTAVSLDFPCKGLKNLVMRIPRKVLYSIDKDMAVRLLGGYRMLVLAK